MQVWSLGLFTTTEILTSSINRTAKASLALSIARLIPNFYWTHKASIVVACLSALIGLGIVIQSCIFCARIDKTWSQAPPYRCTVTNVAGIIRIGCEFILLFLFFVWETTELFLGHAFLFLNKTLISSFFFFF